MITAIVPLTVFAHLSYQSLPLVAQYLYDCQPSDGGLLPDSHVPTHTGLVTATLAIEAVMVPRKRGWYYDKVGRIGRSY